MESLKNFVAAFHIIKPMFRMFNGGLFVFRDTDTWVVKRVSEVVVNKKGPGDTTEITERFVALAKEEMILRNRRTDNLTA